MTALDSVAPVVGALRPIGLDELVDRAELLTRLDRKYMLPLIDLPLVVGGMDEDMQVLEANAALYSAGDLTIGGSGSLTVKGNGNDAIAGKDGLVVEGGNITVEAADDGIRGKDYLVVNGGTVAVTAKGDGLKSDNADEEDTGYIAVAGGTVSVTAGGDAVDADGKVVASYVTSKTIQNVVYSGAAIKSGEEYTVYSGGTTSGTDTGGLAASGRLGSAKKLTTVTAGEAPQGGGFGAGRGVGAETGGEGLSRGRKPETAVAAGPCRPGGDGGAATRAGTQPLTSEPAGSSAFPTPSTPSTPSGSSGSSAKSSSACATVPARSSQVLTRVGSEHVVMRSRISSVTGMPRTSRTRRTPLASPFASPFASPLASPSR